MGYQLRRWLADRLPDTLSSGERLVALEIADQANDHTRRAWGDATLATILRRTGYADDKQLGKVLGKLAEHGVELRVPVRDAGLSITGFESATPSTDPLAAVRSLSSLASPDGTSILVLQNFHRFLQSAEIVQALVRQITTGKQSRTFIVILAPVVQIPVELERIVLKALRANRDDRYASANALLKDLREYTRRVEFEAELQRSAARSGDDNTYIFDNAPTEVVPRPTAGELAPTFPRDGARGLQGP